MYLYIIECLIICMGYVYIIGCIQVCVVCGCVGKCMLVWRRVCACVEKSVCVCEVYACLGMCI